MKKIIFILIILILLISGCTEMTRKEKNTCYSLTSKSYDYIPYCETEQSCFKKIDKLFETDFDITTESDLFELKNNFARSWFFYNQAIREIKSMSYDCKKGNAAVLPGKVNQSKYYLEEAFSEAEKGINKSFEIITLQEKTYSEEEIDLLKEEELYNVLVEYRQILIELEEGQGKSKNYVTYYFDKINKFNKYNQKNNFYYVIEKDNTIIKYYHSLRDSVLEQFNLKKEIKLPVLSNLDGFFEYLELQLYLSESTGALKLLPAQKLMILYSEIAGNNHSVLEEFSKIINKSSKSYKKIENQIIPLNKNIKQTKSKINNLLNQKNYPYLEKELLQGEIKNNNEISSLSEETNKQYYKLKEKQSKGQITIGKKLAKLKTINKNYLKIEKHLLLKNQNNHELIKSKCITKAGKIHETNELNKKSLQTLQHNLIFFSKRVKSNNILLFENCKKMIKTEKELEEGIQNYEKLKNKKMDLTKNCFEYLERLFDTTDSFYEQKQLFNELKKTVVTEENLFYFEEACGEIKRQVNFTILDKPEIKMLDREYKKLKENHEKIKKINFLKNNLLQKEEENIKDKINDFSEYFNNLPKLLNLKDEIFETLDKENKKTETIINKNRLEIIEDAVKVEIIEPKIVEINKEQTFIAKVTINNEFEEIKNIILNIKIEGEILSATNNILEYNKTKALFKTLPNGLTIIKIKFKDKINSSEKNSLIYTSNDISIIQKKISFDKKIFANLLIPLKEKFKIKKAEITNQKVERQYIKEGINYFVLEKTSGPVNILLYTKDLFKTNHELKSTRQLNETTFQLTFITKVKNNFEKTNANIYIPISTNKLIEKTNVYLEAINKRFQIIDNKIVLKNQKFEEGETKEYKTILQVKNTQEYYSKELTKIKNELSSFGEKNLSQRIDDLLDIRFNKKVIPDYELLLKLGKNKLNEIDKELILKQNKLMLENEVEEKIEEIEKIKDDLETLKLNDKVEEVNNLLNEINNNKKGNVSPEKILAKINEFDFDIEKEILNYLETLNGKLLENNITELKEERNKLIIKADNIKEKLKSNPVEGKKYFVELKKEAEKYFEDKEILIKNQKNKEDTDKKKIKELTEKSKAIIVKLRQELHYSPEEMVKARFVQPITKRRIEQLELDLIELEDDELLEAKEIYAELLAAEENIKRQTIKEYNSSISNLPKEKLSKAKNLIDNNKFTDAFFALKQKKEPNYFFGLIPIVITIVFLIIIKFNFSSNKKKKDKVKEKVLEEWD